ncbi:MAG: NINE protein [Candidatus Heimdallarchaeota archaeon]|nr:NINE protein [Candidatus Heimdallarchaeota archaeon]
MSETLYCPMCGQENPIKSRFCQGCGSKFESHTAAPPIPEPSPETPPTGTYTNEPYQTSYARPPKDRTIAGILALLLGGLGVHKFYLDNMGAGLLYLCFCWTGIPTIIGIIEGIIYLTESDEDFQRNHVYPQMNQ